MMKQLRNLCTLLLLAVASMAWADDVVFYTLDTTGSLQGTNNSYTGNCDVTSDGITWNFTGNSQMNPWRIGGKNITNQDKSIYSKTAMGAAITKLDVTVGTASGITVNSVKLIVASDANFSNQLDEVSAAFAASSTLTFAPTSGTEWATGAYYKLVFNVSVSGSSNKFLQLSKLEFYKSDDGTVTKKTANVTIDKTTLAIGETATVTTDGPAVTLVSEDDEIATVSGNTITAVGAGEVSVTATWEENDEYNAGEKEFTITVKAPVEIEDGVFDFALGTNYGSGYEGGAVKVQEGTWTAGNVTMTAAGRNCWYNGTAGQPGTTFRVYKESSSGNDAGTITFAVPEGKVITQIVFEGTATMDLIKASAGSYSNSTDKKTGTWTGSVNSVTFTATGTAVFNKITVTYGEGAEKKDAGLAYAEASLTKNVGDEAFVNELTNPNSLTVTYSSSNEAVATVDADGKVTLVAEGTTTITATFAGDDEYNAGSASYTLKVEDPNKPGSTQENPYTVAQARDAIDANEGVTGVYVKGIVSGIVSAYNATYGNISYNISEDGTTEADQLQAYRGFSYNGDKFTSADDIQVGDKVVIYGNLKKYNSTYEFDANNQLVSLERENVKESAGLAYSATSFTARIGEDNTFPTLDNPNTLDVTYESSNTDVATIDESGNITLVAAGETTITAKSAETEKYYAGEASYTLTVKVVRPLVTVDEDGNVTFDLSDNGWGFPTDKTVEEGSFSNSGYTIKVAGSTGNGYNFNSSGFLLMGKKDAYLTLPAFDFDVEKIEVTGASGASDKVVQNIFVDEEAVSTGTTGAKSVNSYEIASDYQAAGNVYTLKVTSAHNTQITEIKVYKKSAAEIITVTISEKAKGKNEFNADRYYGTLYYSNKNLKMKGSNLLAKPVRVEDGKITDVATFQSNTEDVIPAGIAVLLEAMTAGDYEFEVVAEHGNSSYETILNRNMLKGTDEAAMISEAGYKYYMLSLNAKGEEGSVGFYWGKDSNEGTQIANGAHKAYLAVPEDVAAGVRGFTFGGETTGIEAIDNSQLTIDNGIYNLAGQRVAKAQKGVYIVGGKKVVIR